MKILSSLVFVMISNAFNAPVHTPGVSAIWAYRKAGNGDENGNRIGNRTGRACTVASNH